MINHAALYKYCFMELKQYFNKLKQAVFSCGGNICCCPTGTRECSYWFKLSGLRVMEMNTCFGVFLLKHRVHGGVNT